MLGTAKFTRWSNYMASVCWPRANRPHVGVLNSFCQLGESSSCSGVVFFLTFCRNDRIFGGLYFWTGFTRCAKKKHLRYSVFGKSMLLFPSLTGSRGDAQPNRFLANFSFRPREREKKDDRFISFDKNASFSLAVATSVSQQFRAVTQIRTKLLYPRKVARWNYRGNGHH